MKLLRYASKLMAPLVAEYTDTSVMLPQWTCEKDRGSDPPLYIHDDISLAYKIWL